MATRRYSKDVLIDVTYTGQRYASQLAGALHYFYDCRVRIKDERRISFTIETHFNPQDLLDSEDARNIDKAAAEALNIFARAEQGEHEPEAGRIEEGIRRAALEAARERERNPDIVTEQRFACFVGARVIFRTRAAEKNYIAALERAKLGRFVVYSSNWGYLVQTPSGNAGAEWDKAPGAAKIFETYDDAKQTVTACWDGAWERGEIRIMSRSGRA